MIYPATKGITNLKLMLDDTVKRYGAKTAIVFGECRLSYVELDEASKRVSSALLKMGVGKGDLVAMLLSNRPEFVTMYFGIVNIGAVAVPLDTKYKFAELASIIGDCQPKFLVTEDATLELILSVLSQFQSIKKVINVGAKHEEQFVTYHEMMLNNAPSKIDVVLSPDDIANITYTSGPSLNPVGAVLTHQSLVISAATSAWGFRQTAKDVVPFFILPMFHMFALVAEVLGAIYKGSTLVMIPGTGLSIGSLLGIIEKERGTLFLGVPYIYALLNDMAEKDGIKNDLSSLRICVSAGAPLPLDTIRRFRQLYGFEIFDCWGLTETVCLVTCPPVKGSRKIGSVGKALPSWKIKIADDEGKELPFGVSGEIIVRGPMMTGYYQNPRATAEVLKEGWLYTGDIGKLDADGTLYITGRKKDMIIVKGQNIHPSDIEMILSAHPKVAGVAVIGVPDGLRGEIIGAVVSVRPRQNITEPELKRYCLERIATYKVPKQFYFLDSLPKTVNGKIDKLKVRELLSIPPVFPETASR
jgi:long-chain acyl-CoA synthetase